MRLRHITDSIPGITRHKKGNSFVYTKAGKPVNEKTKERIEKLVIPPAWSDVWISPVPNGHIQATGRDEKGRKQYIYHEQWNKRMQQNKFDKIIFFGEVLPRIRKEVKKGMDDQGLTQRKIISTIVWLLGKTYIRVGNEEYAEQNHSYGLTTMRMKHVDVIGDTIRFDFKGKSGKYHSVEVEHPKVAKTIRKLEDLPGYELFQYLDSDNNRHSITSDEINQFLKTVTGEDITAKDFRTWGGTVFAAEDLYKAGNFDTKEKAKRQILETVKLVSQHLGNTTTVCRTYYIHPTVIETYERQELIPYFETSKRFYNPSHGLTQSEYLVHRLIKKFSDF